MDKGKQSARPGPRQRKQFNRNRRNRSKSDERKAASTTPAAAPQPTGSSAPAPRSNRAGPPKPAHLSKTSSEARNDPLWKDSFYPDPGCEVRPDPGILNVYSSCEGLTSIITEVYSQLIAANQGFARRVPESAFAYYCAVITYARLLYIHRMNGYRTTDDEQDFVYNISVSNYPLPDPVATYISGFGNTSIPDGGLIKWRRADITYFSCELYNCWFGRVGPRTHYLYAAYPCLAVYAMRIVKDLTCQHSGEGWNLPREMAPVETAAGNLTRNMLGYALTTKLRAEQTNFITNAGVSADTFESFNSTLVLNTGLMASVADELAMTTKTFPQFIVNFTIGGSQAEVPREMPSPSEVYPVTGQRIITRGSLITRTAFNIDGRITYAAGMLLYRLIKEAVPGQLGAEGHVHQDHISDLGLEVTPRKGIRAAAFTGSKLQELTSLEAVMDHYNKVADQLTKAFKKSGISHVYQPPTMKTRSQAKGATGQGATTSAQTAPTGRTDPPPPSNPPDPTPPGDDDDGDDDDIRSVSTRARSPGPERESERGVLHHYWCVYEFNRFTNVPRSWRETRNALRDQEPWILNPVKNDGFSCVAFDARARLRRWIQQLNQNA